MRGHASPFEEELDRGGTEPDLDALMHELVGDRVVVVLDGDVVVDVDGGVAPVPVKKPDRHFRRNCLTTLVATGGPSRPAWAASDEDCCKKTERQRG